MKKYWFLDENSPLGIFIRPIVCGVIFMVFIKLFLVFDEQEFH